MNHLDDRIFNLLNRIRELIKTIPDAELLSDFPIFYHEYTVVMDAVIRKSEVLLAVFEMKPYEKRLQLTDIKKVPIDDKPIAKYTILTNGEQIFVRDQFTKSVTDVKSPEVLVNLIFKLLSDDQVIMKRREIAQAMEKEVKAFFEDNPEEKWEGKMREHLSFYQLFEHLHYDKNGQFFRLGTNITDRENFENQLFNILLEDVARNQNIYRYAALDTMFATVKYQSIRMNGIAGMNDPSELDYADRYFDQQFSIFTDQKELRAANRRFITCCSEHADILSQWRLYGDDCQGACLVFSIQQSEYSAGMRVKKVSYGRYIGGKVYHPELELVKRLLATVRNSTDQLLQLKSFGVWKHFFKPFEYTEEREVRVLMVLNNEDSIKGTTQLIEKQWNLTSSHQIIAPYIHIPLRDQVLPIRLESITLGSKCPEKGLNAVQLEILLQETGLGHIKVNTSKINNYR